MTAIRTCIELREKSTGKAHTFDCLEEPTKKFYFKEAHHPGTIGDRSESVLGIYAKAYDNWPDGGIICFFTDDKDKNGNLYYTPRHYVTKRDIDPYKIHERGNRYSFKIKHLAANDLQERFNITYLP